MKLSAQLFFFFALSIFNLAPAQGAQNACVNSGQTVLNFSNDKMWNEQAQALAVYSAKNDLQGFCEWNRMDRSTSTLLTKPKLNEYREEKNKGDRDSAAQILDKGELWQIMKAPWQASMLGHPKLKNKAETAFENICQKKGGVLCASEISKNLARTDLHMNYAVPEYYSVKKHTVSQKQLTGACAYLSPLSTVGCTKAGNELVDLLEVHSPGASTAPTTAVPMLKETLADSKITSALQNVASTLWDKIARKDFSPKDDVFSALKTELEKNGLAADVAKKQAVKILGTIATGGPHFYMRINRSDVKKFPTQCSGDQSCNLNGVFLSAIAEALPLADTIKMEKGFKSTYSLPSNVNFGCDSGKAYHFWMTAALTDRLMDRGYSAGAAKSAVYVSHLGYQLASEDVSTRDGVGSLLKMPRFGSAENGVRMDLNLAAAGTSFGASLRDKEPHPALDMHKGYVNSLENSSLTPSNTPESTSDLSSTNVFDWIHRTDAKDTFKFYP